MCALITARCFTIKHIAYVGALWKFVTKASIAFEANNVSSSVFCGVGLTHDKR